ncbi:DUF3310 domain-containing protein [Herbiconiux daphne]|uniref:DUF3310 domain-containing protein n=1 Tax=Herbiconiux daphne TaxID=2970914 RepID=A0ABT2HBA9_9MICO|nr:DUF3310 domain-containing protein [Herbiconiux daphne]MCS5737157.1 DUF3310 domain-containing protein [Herbiconiux daphne]
MNNTDKRFHDIGTLTGADLKITGGIRTGETYRQTIAGDILGRRGSSYVNCTICGCLYQPGTIHFCPGQKASPNTPVSVKITPEDFQITTAKAPDNHAAKAVNSQPEKEMVNHPNHYAGGNGSDIECIDAIRAALTEEEFKGFCKGNAIKYVWRAGKKDAEIQEFKKAKWYLEEAIGE